jgi:hypothetical protein
MGHSLLHLLSGWSKLVFSLRIAAVSLFCFLIQRAAQDDEPILWGPKSRSAAISSLKQPAGSHGVDPQVPDIL